ncbi:unnamed protein product [Psylliodes chrysocephalus]|uniref:J domain-containing protein n=1 Tax=Psylliodes chrysocephalus TaxID=3402493 RepID=A0A9P0GAB4_9CUCU|nr:unnamed protein product [Psylliodes chrysocephala]
MYSFSHLIRIQSISIFNHFSSKSKTHYDVLNLPRNCTSKEIKEAFIKLSKENHPDLNKNKDAHKKFLALNESYKVLSNAVSRRNYDLSLIPDKEVTRPGPQIFTRSGSSGWNDPTFYSNRNKKEDKQYEQKPYYGIKGQERVSNVKVVSICVCMAIFLVSLQFFLIAKSATFQRDHLIKRSQETEDEWKLLKKTVEENGNNLQIEILKSKFAEKNQSDKKDR